MSSFSPRSRRFVVSLVISCSIVAAVLFGVVTRAEFDPAAMFAPVISVTKSDTSLSGDGDGKADPGETIGYTVQINNTGPDPATSVVLNDTIDPNTTLVPGSVASSAIAINDAFPTTVIGNVSINSVTITGGPYSVLTNDYLGLNPAATITSFSAISANGGNVVLDLGTGTFTYDPPAGFEGTDTFTYVLTDNANATSAIGNRTGTVSINVSGMVWFINNGAAACTVAGCGRLSNPFSTLAAFNALNNGTGNNPAAGDNIFIYERPAAYTGGVTLLNNQRLIGEDSQASLSAITGLTPPAGSPAFPAMNLGGQTVDITNTTGTAITLADGNTVRGLRVTDASISGIAGTATTNTAIIAGNNDVTITGVDGTALGNGALSFNGGNGNITFSGTITGNNGDAVHIRNRAGGIVTIQGPVTSATRGVVLTANGAATIAFTAGLSLTTTTNAAFTATGGGTVTATQNNSTIVNTLTTTTGTALNIANTNIGATGVTFRSISSNGATNGVVLNTTGSAGGLTVTGNSAGICGGSVGAGPPASAATTTAPNTADCTGGTIQASTGPGMILTNTSSVSLTRMRVINGGNDGVQGTNVTGFSLISSYFDNNGNAINENGLDFGDSSSTTPDGLHGTGVITNSAILNSYYNGASVRNSGGSALASFNVTGSQFRSLPANGDSNDSLFMEAGGTASMALSVSGSHFSSIEGDHIQTTALNSGTLTAVNITNNTLTGGHSTPLGQGITINAATGVPGWNGRIDYDINGNNINQAVSNAASVVLGTSAASAVFDGFVRNNVIGTSGVAFSCSSQANGVYIDARGNGTHNSSVSGNTIRRCFDRGILTEAGDGDSVLNLTVQSNTIDQQIDDPLTREAIHTNFGITSTNVFSNVDTPVVCLQLGGAGGLGNTFSHGVGAPDDFRLRKRFEATVRLPGYAGGTGQDAGSLAAVVAFIQGQNTGSAGEPGSASASGTGGGYTGGAGCTQPTAPPPVVEDVAVVEDSDQRTNDLHNTLVAELEKLNSSQLATGVAIVEEGKANETGVFQSIGNFANRVFSTIMPTASAQSMSETKTRAPESGETVSVSVGTLPAGKSVTITFSVTVDALDLGEIRTRILNQGTVSSNIQNVLTTDPTPNLDPACTAAPSIGTATCTPVDRPDTTINSTNRVGSTPTNAASVSWTATFGTQIAGLTASNFTLLNTAGPCSSPSITSVTPVGGSPATAWTITASTGTGSCTLGLNLVNSGGLSHDVFLSPIPTALPFVGETIVIDKVAPSTTSFLRFLPVTSPTNADTLVFQVTFSEAVTGVDTADFAVSGTTATATLVTPVSSSVYNVTASGGDLAGLNGTVGLNFSGAMNITDIATNPLPNTEPAADETYLLDNQAPTVDIVDVTPDPRNTAVTSIVINFSEPVTGFDLADLALTRDASPVSLSGATLTGGPTSYTLGGLTAPMTGINGAYVLTLTAPGGIADTATNALAVGATDAWAMDTVAPTVTINQAAGQADPTFAEPINFTVVFSEPVTDFDDPGDLTLSSTGPGTITGVISGGPTTYNVAVSGMTDDGVVTASVSGNAATDAAGNLSAPSTSTDNAVTFVTCVPPPPNMRAWYTGDGTLRDIAAGYDAVSGGSPATTYAAGKVGQAFDLNGTTQYVGRTDTTGMDTNASAFSFDAWIRREGNLNGSSHEGLITKMTTTSSNLDSFASFIYDNATPGNNADDNFYVVINGASTFNTANGTVPPVNTWFHYAQTYDGTNIRVYVNGAQVGIFAFAGRAASTGQLYIGGRGLVPTGVQHPFNGQIDEVEVFDRTLTPAEISSLVAADGGGKCKPFDLRIDKEDVNAPFDQGAAESYTLVVTNDGPATTSGTTTVTDTFPAGITPGAATGTNWSCNTTLQVLTCTSTQAITAGNVFPTITVPVTVAQNAPASVSNTATVATSPTTGELDTSDNSDTEVTAVTGFALTPSVTNGSTLEDTQTANGQLVITPNVLDGSEVTHYKITNIANGSLFQNNGTTPIAAGSFITAAQGAAGLRFTPALNFFGNGSFDVTASTSASDAGLGGAPATATIVVTAVNDAPTLNDPADMNINEDAGLQTVNLLGITSGVINEAGQTLAVTATSDTPGLIPNPTILYTSPNASATLTFTPVANVSGVAIITVTVTDNGGTANGGVNTFSQTFTVTVAAVNDAPTLNDPSDMTILEDAALQTVNLSGITAGPNETQVLTVTATSDTPGLIPNPTVSYTSANTTGSLTFTPVPNQSGSAIVTVTVTDNGGTANGGVNTFSQTFTVNVTAVNDAPTLNDPADVTILEDAALQTVNLSGITAGPLESQTLVVTATSGNPGLIPNPTVTYTSANTTGSLAFTPVANQSGSAVITVTVTDNGGTANGGVNTFSQTFTVNVTAVNDAPTLNDPADITILEDAALQTVNLSGITAGPFETQVLTVTASSNNTGLIPNPTVTYTSANATGTLTFTPVANANGTAIVTVTVTDDGGTANGGVNTFTQTFTVNVTAVNDPPTFAAGPNVTRVVNQGPQTVNPWATGITTGPANESGQTLTGFTVTGNTNPGLFSAAPAISTAGVLTFTSATGAIGTASITLTLSDNGGTANGGSDTSAPQTFTITINPGATTTALASSLNPSPLGAPVTFTATVTPNAPSGGVPQGTVEFRDNNVPIGTGTLNGAGVATFTTSSLTSGPHPITAVYLGSSAFNGSTSPVLIQVVDLPPTAAGTAPTVVTGGGTTHTVTVTYTDDFAINVASLDSNDIRVTGPNAFNSAVTFTGVNINTNGTPRVATYTFTAPGGSWDLGDNGTYSIVMQANQVVDSANQPVAVGSIGTFVVNIPPVTISGNIRQYFAAGPNTPLAGVTVTLTSNNVPVPGPATTNANGDYVITNVSHGANVVVTPSGLGKVYDPLTRTFNNVTTNTTADFIAYDPNAIPRTIKVVDTYPVPGAALAVPIVMNSQGTETFVSFSLNYNINPLASNPTASCGAGAAPGCSVTFSNVTPGQIGVTITNPVPFTAGPAEIAVINFQTLANNLANAPLTFGDAPVVRLVNDASGNPLPATYINGLIVFAQGIEGDVANRNIGNGTFESADIVQMRRFIAGLDAPVATNNEFQRADTAPSATKGDGNLNSTDLVQTRRYVAGLDAPQAAGGPGVANTGPMAPPVMERSSGASAAEITIGKASGSTDSRVKVPVGMRSNGDEVAVNFVVRYDATRLGNVVVDRLNTADGATLTANTDEPGVIRVLVDASASFARSNAIETLVNISFDITSTASTGDTRILIEETTVSDASATSLPVKTTNGSISIAGPNAVAVDISGRVLTPNGAGLRNAIVTLTDANGATRTVTTATFGYYRFESVTQGETYTIAVSSRRFRFDQQRIIPSDNVTAIDFTGQE